MPTPTLHLSKELHAHWDHATRVNSESTWSFVPENITDEFEKSGRWLSAADVEFLGMVAVSDDVHDVVAVAAIRLMGMAAKDHYHILVMVIPLLRSVLGHKSAQRRYYGVTAAWMARSLALVPDIQRLRDDPGVSNNANFCDIIDRAVKVLMWSGI